MAPIDLTNQMERGRLRTLYQLLEALLRAKSLPDVYEVAMDSLLKGTEADRAAVLLFDADGVMRFEASRGLSAEYQHATTGHSPWPQGVRNCQPLIVPDVRHEESLKDLRDVLERENIQALVFVPLELSQGVFGKFMLYYSNPHACAEDEAAVAQAIAGHVAIAVERARADEARAESERRLQSILDNSPTSVFLKDPQGRYILVNRQFEKMFRLPQSDVLGRTDHAVFPSEAADRFVKNDRKVAAAERPLQFEERVPQAGGVHTYLVTKFPIRIPPGERAGICGIATDITDRKERELLGQRLAAIVESTGDAIFCEDLNGNITTWNASAEHIFGYSANEAIGKSAEMLQMPGLVSSAKDSLENGAVHRYETSLRRRNGQSVEVSLTVSPLRAESGGIAGVSNIARDITERRQAERERARLLAREQEARKNAELLNQIAPRIASELNLDKLVQDVIEIATLLMAASFGAFLRNASGQGGETTEISAVSGPSREEAERLRMPLLSALFDKTAGLQSVRCDDAAQDGRFDPAMRSYLAVPVLSRSGDVAGGLIFGHVEAAKFSAAHEEIAAGIAAQTATAMDNARLFEQARWVQKELKRSNQQLRRANQDLETFAYSASHDLQEPLRTISLSAQLLEQSCAGKLEPQESAFLTRILSAANGMRTLLRDLLDYTKTTRYTEGPAQWVEAERVLADVLTAMDGTIREAGATITKDELPVIRVHEPRLAQLFQNLIGNAIKYRGSDPPRIHVSASRRDAWTIFSITDNGIGVDRQYGEQIFGLFKRLHSRDEFPGSGIGLAICQRIVEDYGGRIWLDQSAPGAGSTFSFSLPSRPSE